MKKVIYPGTFDPITFGHIDLIKKALNIFDNLIIAISDGNNKEYLFSAEEREYLVKKSLFNDLKFKSGKQNLKLHHLSPSSTSLTLSKKKDESTP